MNSKVVLILVIFVMLSSNVLALTGSIGNARMVLYPEVGFLGTTIEKSILVKNVNDVAVNIKLEASDEEFAKMVNIIDKEFTLEPGEEKKANFKINIKKPGDYEGKIAVFFSEEGGKTGVALSSTIIIIAGKKGSIEPGEEEEEECVDDECLEILENKTLQNPKNTNTNINFSLAIPLISTTVLAAIFIFLLFKLNKRAGKKIKRDRR